MAGGATFSPQLLVDGKRPLDKYPPAKEMLQETLKSLAAKPLFPVACAKLFWPVYQMLLRRCKGRSDAACFTLAFSLSTASTYSFWHLFYAFIEKKRLLEEHKLDRQPHQLGSIQLVLATLKQGLLGKIVTGPALVYCVLHPVAKWCGMGSVKDKCPSVARLYWQILFSHTLNEFAFYWAHRTVHSSSLYAKIHKQHHEWKGTVSMASEYSHPVEQLFANMLPTIAGPLLLSAHPWIFCVWVSERLRNTYDSHSGYAFRIPLLNSLGVVNWRHQCQHDFHHTGNCGNFGVDWCDWMFGTMDSYVAQGGAEGYVQTKADEKLSYMRH